MSLKRAILVGVCLAGPLAALLSIWYPAISVVGVPERRALAAETVQELRSTPSDATLDELHDFAVSFPNYDNEDEAAVLQAADELLAGTYSPNDKLRLGVPFESGAYVFGYSGWHLDLHSFAIPALLARAYEISRDRKYLEQAVRYVVDWADYESSLWLPLGFTFNDHAIAARSIVTTEVWRLYRHSGDFDDALGSEYLDYVRKLMQLLMKEPLYEYRTNHGIMQCLSLLHLGIAFPSLPESAAAVERGVERLKAQMSYYVDEEGVILEHSASYHINGVMRLSAAWRYFGLAGVPVSADMMHRYEKSLRFGAALLRPDRSLPLIGDTGDHEYWLYSIAEFDDSGLVSGPMRQVTASDLVPEPVTIHAAAGFAVLWDGLSAWPKGPGLTQTVLNWGNFPSQVHKHADEMAISMWQDATDWIRGVGSWPYSESRQSAIGWRSSNAPHWLNERADSERDISLEESAATGAAAFFDIVRTNGDGRSIRRQIVKAGDSTWVVLDGGSSAQSESVETVWRFSPELVLTGIDKRHFRVTGRHGVMDVQVDGSSDVSVEMDAEGSASWNSGLMDDGKVAQAPALRVLSRPADIPTTTAFRLYGLHDVPASSPLRLEWRSENDWALRAGEGGDLRIERSPGKVSIQRPADSSAGLRLSAGLSPTAEAARADALAAYRAAVERYGKPFDLMLMKRIKVSIAALLAILLQLSVLWAIGKRNPGWLGAVAVGSLVCWLGLAAYVRMHYLV